MADALFPNGVFSIKEVKKNACDRKTQRVFTRNHADKAKQESMHRRAQPGYVITALAV